MEILQAISIIIASFAAVYGIIAWRNEHLGRRKIDLAEEVLCGIYEIRDLIKMIRNPFGYVDEGNSRKKNDNESKEESDIYDQAYVVYERYNKVKDKFHQFLSLEYRYIANFGKEADFPFVTIKQVVNQIFHASDMLARFYWKRQGRIPMDDKQFNEHLEQMHQHEATFWEHSKEDEINIKVDKAINYCERICNAVNKITWYNMFKIKKSKISV